MALIALAVTVTVGVGLGAWMVTMALRTPASMTPDHGHDDAGTAAHTHEDAGVVAMPGLAAANSAAPAAMAGMSAADMAAMAQPAPAQPTPDTMAGMSAAEMAAMSHDASADQPGRPLGLTLAGFVLVNLSVLVAAVVLGRRRKTHAAAAKDSPRRQDPSRGTQRGTPSAQAGATSAAETTGSMS